MSNAALPPNAVDLEGLGALRRRAQQDDPAALADVAVQFEALFIGMMLESARSASVGSGVFDSGQTEQYLALMDRQVALELARSGGFGFGKMLVQQLAERRDVTAQARGVTLPPAAASDAARTPAAAPAAASAAAFPSALPPSLAALGVAQQGEPRTEPTPAEFISSLLPDAKAAAAALGVEPRLLLAQAALETGWGRSLPRRDGESSNNLFGIKAGAAWDGAAVEHWTLEHEGGVTTPQREKFKAYDNVADSFRDYVELISTSRRYAGALPNAGDAEAYARAVTKAGYATDPSYADKWLAIYHGDRLQQALRGIDLP